MCYSMLLITYFHNNIVCIHIICVKSLFHSDAYNYIFYLILFDEADNLLFLVVIGGLLDKIY